jgi:hypothetical protein
MRWTLPPGSNWARAMPQSTDRGMGM